MKGKEARAAKLLELAREDFGKLTRAEAKFFKAVAKGEVADYRSKSEEKNDPARAEDWGRGRVLKGDRIEWVCTEPEAAALVGCRGIRVKGARVSGELSLEYAKIEFPLRFENCVFTERIDLRYASVRGLYFKGTHSGAVAADGMRVEGDVFLGGGFTAEGEVRLLGAGIGGDLDCVKGEFVNPGGYALNADGMEVGGSVFLSEGFKAEGEVRLLGAEIGGQLDCTKGEFVNPGRYTLKADGVGVEGDVFLSEGFKAEGEVRLLGAEIGGDLDCMKGEFVNPGGDALSAHRIKVEGSMFLRGGFKAEGKVVFVGAKVSGHFVWSGVDSPEKVTVDLRSARIGTLLDGEESWPDSGKLFLHGLIYDGVDDRAPKDAGRRIGWLRRQPSKPFRPQPYEQLAAVLRKEGRREDAKKILIAKEEDRRRFTEISLLGKLWHGVLGVSIGHGYRPARALWFIVAIILLGSFLFGAGFRGELLTPTKKEAYVSVEGGEDRRVSEEYPKFHAVMYSLDVLVPLVDLHQASYWLPNANRPWGGALRSWLWFQIVSGWGLTTLLVVSLTGLVRREG